MHHDVETCAAIADVLAAAGYLVEWIVDAHATPGRVSERRYALLVAEVDPHCRPALGVLDAVDMDPGLPLLLVHDGDDPPAPGRWGGVPLCRAIAEVIVTRVAELARPRVR